MLRSQGVGGCDSLWFIRFIIATCDCLRGGFILKLVKMGQNDENIYVKNRFFLTAAPWDYVGQHLFALVPIFQEASVACRLKNFFIIPRCQVSVSYSSNALWASSSFNTKIIKVKSLLGTVKFSWLIQKILPKFTKSSRAGSNCECFLSIVYSMSENPIFLILNSKQLQCQFCSLCNVWLGQTVHQMLLLSQFVHQ